ncbi:uncharacterized protein LOC107262897 [Cephus cinctus]|uniref:Uncharacterized protein LOC107262897 n=1 Tax=Cephus cinctus TaxID=211228 RepID=A0AAJ7BFT4_CEPCN|nr:uncharacterized protein LOC107262897 [Cephus cinctus]
MSNIKILFVITCCILAVSALNTDCTYGPSTGYVDDLLRKCPRFTESSDKTFCCMDPKTTNTYCCTAEEFATTVAIGFILPAVIAVVVIVSLIVLCISCLCCSCCPWYRRRHRGTVYGHVHTTPVIHVIQTPANSTSHTGHSVTNPQYNVYPNGNVAMTGTTQPPEPQQYTTEAYNKQAPYNPNYRQ